MGKKSKKKRVKMAYKKMMQNYNLNSDSYSDTLTKYALNMAHESPEGQVGFIGQLTGILRVGNNYIPISEWLKLNDSGGLGDPPTVGPIGPILEKFLERLTVIENKLNI